MANDNGNMCNVHDTIIHTSKKRKKIYAYNVQNSCEFCCSCLSRSQPPSPIMLSSTFVSKTLFFDNFREYELLLIPSFYLLYFISLWVESTMWYVDVGCFSGFAFYQSFHCVRNFFWIVWREKENRKTHLDCNLKHYFTIHIHIHIKAFQMLSCTLPRIQMFYMNCSF